MSRLQAWATAVYENKTHIIQGVGCGVAVVGITALLYVNPWDWFTSSYEITPILGNATSTPSEEEPEPTLDKEAYARKMLALANNGLLAMLNSTSTHATTTATSTPTPQTAREIASTTDKAWPADLVFPKPGAILPFNRIVAYYGNFYSTRMGALGEYPEDEVLRRLQEEVDRWESVDPDTPVVPAIDYIAVTAQGNAGADGMYRLRMPDDQIDHALDMANKIDGIVILEVQAGLSDLQQEIKALEPYLSQPQVHLAIDPEFHMVTDDPPGTVIGSVSARDINRTIEYLAELVQEHDLPPKVLVVHRFTLNMVRNSTDITPTSEVQVVMDMDGWGSPAKKFGTYHRVIEPFPVQFTGFKIFYKNDLKPPSTRLLTPEELLELSPQPSFIQYQ